MLRTNNIWICLNFLNYCSSFFMAPKFVLHGSISCVIVTHKVLLNSMGISGNLDFSVIFTKMCSYNVVCCALQSTEESQARHSTNLWKAKPSSEFPWPRAVTRHPGGCMAAVSSSLLFSFGLVARGCSFTHRLWLVQTMIQPVCVWACFRARRKNRPESKFPRCSLSSCSSRHQFLKWRLRPEKAGVLHSAANRVKGSAVFISWMDLLRKGIPLEAKGAPTDGWGRWRRVR